MGDILFPVEQYPELRTFYGQVENKDQESVVLKLASASDKTSAPGN
jgi:hypothetical protein